jgi:hypothetical protein
VATGPDIFVGATIPILSINIVPITIAVIITHPQTGDTRTIASRFARTTNRVKLGTFAGKY